MAQFQFLRLRSNGSGKVTFDAADGKSYILDPNQASGSSWHFVYETNSQKAVMAFRRGSPFTDNDGELVISIDGAISGIATLLHHEDDYPRKYYFATDGYNNNPLNRQAFILRADGINGCPVQPWVTLQIMLVKP